MERRAPRPDWRIALGVCVIALVFYGVLGSVILPGAKRTDFLNLYTGATLARTGQWSELYDLPTQIATQESLEPGLAAHFPFVRPPFYAALLAPLSLMNLDTAFWFWIALQTAGMLAAWAWAWGRFGPDAMLYAAFFLPASLGIVHGQDCILLLLIAIAAWTALERGYEEIAGVILALTLIKFHLFLLLPMAMLLRRRWRLLAGYGAAGLSFATISIALVGFPGVEQYIALLTRHDLDTLSPSPEQMIGLNSIAVNLRMDFVWFKLALAAAVTMAAGFAARRTATDWQWLWAAVTASMLLSPHTYGYDLTILLLPGLLGVFSSDNRIRISSATLLIPLPYLLVLAGPPLAAVPSLVVLGFLLSLCELLPQRRTVLGEQPS